MVIHRAFDDVLRSWSHVAVLRAILDSASGLTGNEIARSSGMHPRSALKALTSLEELGIVRRQRGGRDHLFTLNRDHFLTREGLLPLYQAEQKFRRAIEDSLVTLLKGRVLSAVIFGSVSRMQETPQSDLDLCCIVSSENKKGVVQEMLASEAVPLYRNFGVKLAPVFFSLSEMKKKKRSGLIREILNEGKVIVGTKVEELLRGTT
ncbi:MAG: nucleotidyltransferase domain-containing protein [Ignavibacteriales bacterium]|nr:nucleotidyltransferase domain-containing protein [Ignavibacteriales bacterium]